MLIVSLYVVELESCVGVLLLLCICGNVCLLVIGEVLVEWVWCLLVEVEVMLDDV